MKWRLMAMGVIMMVAAGASRAADLPLTDVALFTSGVGFFQHQGLVHDNQTDHVLPRGPDQRYPQVDGVADLSGGTIGPVPYAPRDPLERTLRSFAVDIGDEPALGELLSRLRGAEVEVVTTSAGTVTGTILGTEWQEKSVGDNVLRFEVVNLVTATGMRQVPIWHLESVALMDAELSGDLTRALAAIAANRDVSRRQVELHFNGAGARACRSAICWKRRCGRPATASWSMRTRASAGLGTPRIPPMRTGRARLSVSPPISFTCDLYEPVYVPRPEVPVVPTPHSPSAGGRAEEAAEAEQTAGPCGRRSRWD